MWFALKACWQKIIIGLGLMVLLACDAVPNDTVAGTVENTSQDRLIAGILASDVEQMDELLFYLQNNTAQSVQVLPWNTPLEKFLSADLFNVSIGGERLPYTGRVVKRQAPEAGDFINLEAGERLEAVVVLSQGYDLSRSGKYRIMLESLSLQKPGAALDVAIVDDTVIFTRP